MQIQFLLPDETTIALRRLQANLVSDERRRVAGLRGRIVQQSNRAKRRRSA